MNVYFLSEVGLSQDQNDYIVNFDFFNCLGLRRESVNSNKSCRESVISMLKKLAKTSSNLWLCPAQLKVILNHDRSYQS